MYPSRFTSCRWSLYVKESVRLWAGVAPPEPNVSVVTSMSATSKVSLPRIATVLPIGEHNPAVEESFQLDNSRLESGAARKRQATKRGKRGKPKLSLGQESGCESSSFRNLCLAKIRRRHSSPSGWFMLPLRSHTSTNQRASCASSRFSSSRMLSMWAGLLSRAKCESAQRTGTPGATARLKQYQTRCAT